MSYEDWQRLNAPPWMQGKNAGGLVGGLGKAKDDLAARARAGVLARFPGYAPADALQFKGAERDLTQGPAETNQAYAERIRVAWDTYAVAGAHGTLLRQLEVQGFGSAYLVQDNGWWTRLANPSTNFTVRLATVASLSTWTVGGGGATLTAPTNGTTNFDSFTGLLGDLILVTSGPTAVSPGVYIISQAGNGSQPTILTRQAGWATSTVLAARTSVNVTEGATLAGQRFELVAGITVGVGTPVFEHGLLSGGVIFGDTNTIISRSGPGWMFDVVDTFWSRFLLLYPTAFSPTADQVRNINTIVDKWKPAYAVFEGTVEINSGELWGWPPTRVWGGWTWGGTSTFHAP